MGKGSPSTQTSTGTTYNTNIPEYAKPYVETMLGATQRQLFEGTDTGDGGFNITGFKPYKPYSTNPADYIAGFSPLQQQAQQTVGGMQVPGQYGAATQATGQGIMQALGAGQYQPSYFGSQYQAPGQYTPGQFSMLQAQAPDLQQYQMGPAERVRTDQFTGSQVGQYMSPYLQYALAPQLAEANRQYDISGMQAKGLATQAGAYGGGRQAIMAAENERSRNAALQNIVGQGYSQAYQNAQQQFNQQQQANLQARLANQQAGLTIGQQNLQALLGVQQLGAGQNLQAQLANQQALQSAQQAAEQSRQYGYGQDMTASQLAAQYGLAGQQAAEQSRQFGANLGLQGAQTGIQGASQLANIGAQELQAQQGIAGLQNQFGAQQQSQQQQMINQAIQDYANAQQYPLMQLGVMSNMLRGLPMQAATSNQYVAAPNAITQGIGTAGAAASIYNATKAEGGVIKSMAKGGITSVPKYDVGGEVESQLEQMEPEELEKQARESSSPSIRRMAARLLREKQMARAPQGVGPTGPMGIEYQAPQMAGGGIIAFAKPEEENNYSLVKDKEYDPENPAGGILGNASTLLAKKPPMTADRAIPTAPDFSAEGDPYLAEMKKEHYKQSKLAGRSVEEIAAEREAAMGTNVAAQELRAKVMGERANAEDEAKRQRWLRAAQFFAKWGSTPGPVLVAGMNALNEKLPDIITDERDYKKVKRELDKSIYDLDNATRLEKAGYMKDAVAEKEKAADRAAHSWSEINRYMSGIAREKVQGEYGLEKERIQAKSRMAEIGQRNKEIAARKDELLLANAEDAVAKTRIKISERNARDESLQDDLQTVTMYKTQLANAEGDASKISPHMRNMYTEARERIRKRNEDDAKTMSVVENKLKRTHKKVTGEDYPDETTPPPPPSAAPTTMTMADVEATAKASGRSVEEVKAAAKAKGIKIQ